MPATVTHLEVVSGRPAASDAEALARAHAYLRDLIPDADGSWPGLYRRERTRAVLFALMAENSYAAERTVLEALQTIRTDSLLEDAAGLLAAAQRLEETVEGMVAEARKLAAQIEAREAAAEPIYGSDLP